MSKEKVPIDFHYFIQMTIQKDMTWNTLSFLLTDLAETQEKSKQVIKILVMELKEWVSKVENDSKLDVTKMLDTNEKEANVQRQEDKGNYEKPQENTQNSEDENIIDDTEELGYEPQEEMLDESKIEISKAFGKQGKRADILMIF